MRVFVRETDPGTLGQEWAAEKGFLEGVTFMRYEG